MEEFKLTFGRATWIALLCVLALVARPAAQQRNTAPRIQDEQESFGSRFFGGAPENENLPSSLKPDEDLFAATALPRIRIEIPRAELAILQRYNWQWERNRGQQGRENARATVYEGGRVYTNVAIHLKGSAGSFRQVQDKPAMTLNFDKFAPGQRFHGLKKIHLNNSVQDQSFLSEQISRELCLAADVPTTRATQATVRLNGRPLGIYVLIEGWNKQFLKRHFNNADGTLYDGGFVSDVTRDLAVMSGDENTDRSDLQELVRIARDPNVQDRLTRLEKVLDVDRFLSFLAMETILVHSDGYAMNVNNYRVYRDADSGKFYFMPHGMDQMFGNFRTGPDATIALAPRGIIARAVMQTPEGRARYLDRVGQLYTNVFNTAAISARLDELSSRLKPYISEGRIWDNSMHDMAVKSLRQRILHRGRSIGEQLSMRSRPLELSPSGEAAVKGWKPRQKSDEASLSTVTAEGVPSALKIEPKNGYGSWRARVLLDPGHYRFTARVKVTGYKPLPNDPRSGIGLRLSGDTQLNDRLLQDTGWREISREFDLPALAEVELICEARGARGEILFDAASLKVARAPLAAK